MIKNIITFVILYAAHAANSIADDIELYENGDFGVRPNVMFLLDTSKSMEEREVFAVGEYNPEITYPGPFHSDRYYFGVPANRLDTDGALLNNGLLDRYFPEAAFKCQAFEEALKKGRVHAEFLQWDPDQIFKTGTSKSKLGDGILGPVFSKKEDRQGVWKEVTQTADSDTDHYVDCRADIENGDGLVENDNLYMSHYEDGIAYSDTKSEAVKPYNQFNYRPHVPLIGLDKNDAFITDPNYFGYGIEGSDIFQRGWLSSILLTGSDGEAIGAGPSKKRIASGNYLNYDFYTDSGNLWSWLGFTDDTPVTLAPRMFIMGDAIRFAVENNPGISVGLARFDGTMIYKIHGLSVKPAAQGGMIRIAMTESETEAIGNELSTAKKFETAIKSWDPWGWTPMSEAYYEVARYMRGETPFFGDETRGRKHDGRFFQDILVDMHSVPESVKDGDVKKNYISPITNTCQGNHIIIFTDGEPRLDTDANTAIETLYNTIPVADQPNSLNPSCSTSGTDQYNGYTGILDEIKQGWDEFLGIFGAGNDEGFSSPGHGECADELAYYLANVDQSADSLLTDYDANLPESNQNITTHTIAGFLGSGDNAESSEANQRTRRILRNIAFHGEGSYHEVSTYEGMKNTFDGILGTLFENPSSLASPSVSVSSYNSFGISDELYYSVFKPKNNLQWEGNLKRYRLGVNDDFEPTIFDQKGNNAIDDRTGYFATSAQSYWTLDSEGADGKIVSSGGMASRLTTPRNVFTSKSGKLIPFIKAPGEYNISRALLNIPDEDVEYRNTLIAWANGYDVNIPEEDGSFATPRTAMEDPLHSTPITITYSSGDSSDESSEKALFIGTNSGYLHAFNIDEDAPKEYFSFVPKELLQNLDKYYSGGTLFEHKAYGIDGPLTYWHQDFNGNGQVDEEEQVFLYITMRRGGQSLYALNVTDPDSPKLLWEKHGTYPADFPERNKPAVSDGYANLGQTWAQLEPATVMWDNEQRVVLFTAGGYDPAEDENFFKADNSVNPARITHTKGTTIYMIDALTGEALWDAKEHANMAIGTEMTSSFAANVAPIDSTGDGLANTIYAADVGGRVWRFDINQPSIQFTNTDITTSSAGFANGGIIADVYSNETDGSGNRRFFNEVDVIYQQANNNTSSSVLLSVGSGMRPYPLSDAVTKNYQFVIKDTVHAPTSVNDYNKVEFDDLAKFDASADADNSLDTDELGWYIPLTYTGEKVLSLSNTFSNTLLFSTFAPNDESVTSVNCNADLGQATLYLIGIENGNLSSSTTISLSQSGIPASPSILEVPTEASDDGITYRRAKNVIVGTEVVKAVDSDGAPIALEVGSRYDSVNRDYWFETTKNNDIPENEEENEEESDNDQ